MRVGVSTASLFLRYDNEDAVALLHRMGVELAEVFLTSFSEYRPEFATLLKARKGNVKVHSVHVLNTQIEPQLFNRHHRAKGDSFAILGEVMRSAQILGAEHYTFHGGARFKKASRDPKNDDLPRIGGCLQEIARFCAGYGVALCLENVEWSTYNRPGVFAALKDYVPTLKGVLDIKQARISGFGYQPYLEEMGDRIATVHLSDVREDGKMCLPGQGVFDFETLLKRLKDVGCDAPLLLEAYQNDYNDVEELQKSCEFLQEILYKIG